jgi:hypothetical protein
MAASILGFLRYNSIKSRGMFQPPYQRIFNRIPVHMHSEFWKIKAAVSDPPDEGAFPWANEALMPDLEGYVPAVLGLQRS